MSTLVQLPTKHASSQRTLQPASTAHNCPSCGTIVSFDMEGLEEARRTIRDLETQMDLLKGKAATAVNKCHDYEEQIQALKTASSSNNSSARHNTSDSFDASSPGGRPSTANSASVKAQSRFSFLTGRLTSPVNSTNAPSPPAPAPKPLGDPDLLHELARERALRAKAEDRVRTVDSEIEELSVTLFSQANEMVAEERRARAKLEERIELLEKKDKDKMARLDRLEKAVSRIDRVKALLNKEDMPSTAAASLISSGGR